MSVTPVESTGRGRFGWPQYDSDRILGQIERSEIRTGPEAAREIAQRIEAQGGFWGPRTGVWG
jgi:hypothetical protein